MDDQLRIWLPHSLTARAGVRGLRLGSWLEQCVSMRILGGLPLPLDRQEQGEGREGELGPSLLGSVRSPRLLSLSLALREVLGPREGLLPTESL